MTPVGGFGSLLCSYGISRFPDTYLVTPPRLQRFGTGVH